MSGDRRSRRPRVSAVVPGDRTRPGHGRRYGSTGRVSTVAVARLDRRPRGADHGSGRHGRSPPARNASFTAACVLQGTRACRLSMPRSRGAASISSMPEHDRELRGLERALTMREIRASLATSSSRSHWTRTRHPPARSSAPTALLHLRKKHSRSAIAFHMQVDTPVALSHPHRHAAGFA